jgi:hypothetical protein
VDSNVSEKDTFYSNPESFTDPETRELAGVLRRLERSMQSGPPLDWAETRRRTIEALEELSQADGKTEHLIDLLDGAEYEEGGDEHILFRVDSEPNRIFKATYGDNFGCYSVFDPIDAEFTGKNFNATGNPDIGFYLKRWILLNSLGGYKTRFEGILPPEKPHWLPRICISQPWLDGSNPSSGMISRLMKKAGFLEVSQDSFFLREAGILLTDTAPRNVRIFEDSAIPFDAIAEIASEKVIHWIERQMNL